MLFLMNRQYRHCLNLYPSNLAYRLNQYQALTLVNRQYHLNLNPYHGNQLQDHHHYQPYLLSCQQYRLNLNPYHGNLIHRHCLYQLVGYLDLLGSHHHQRHQTDPLNHRYLHLQMDLMVQNQVSVSLLRNQECHHCLNPYLGNQACRHHLYLTYLR